nr:MAG TPA: SDA1 [Caudoviricetes sp.]
MVSFFLRLFHQINPQLLHLRFRWKEKMRSS